MSNNFRNNRIGEEIKKIISSMIINELKDPRILPLTSITSVKVTNDLRYANVYVSIFGNKEDKEETLEAFKSAAGFIRREIGKKIKLRYTPELIFKLDESIEYGIHISEVIEKTKKGSNDNDTE